MVQLLNGVLAGGLALSCVNVTRSKQNSRSYTMSGDNYYIATSSVIALHPEDPYKVNVIRHNPNKHGGRLTLVGGKIEPDQSPFECAIEEWKQESGGKGAILVPDSILLWATKNDVNADVRLKPLSSLPKNYQGSLHSDVDKVVEAHYGVPDYIFIATVRGEPFPGDDEALECLWYDLRGIEWAESPEVSAFGAQHDLILMVYLLTLTGERGLSASDFTDMSHLRANLRNLFRGRKRRC